jgi:hypothetical protein
MRVAESFGDGDAGESFADGYSVNPDGAGTLRGQFFQFGNGKAEALPEIRKIFSVAQTLYDPIRRAEQGGKPHQEAINEIHL